MIANGFDRLKSIEDRLDNIGRYFAPPPKPAQFVQSAAVRPADTSPDARHVKLTAPMQTFYRWLFGTDDVARANRSAQFKWQRLRDEVRAVGQRLRKR